MFLKFAFNNEIRRLEVGPKANFKTDYVTLRDFATKLFGSVLPKKFALKYKDDEGDLVTLTSDRELREALDQIGDKGILKIVICEVSRDFSEVLENIVSKFTNSEPFFDTFFKSSKLEDEKKKGTNKIGEMNCFGEVHSAICDYCNSQIRGIRWKCAMCKDFDLCNECEKKPRANVHHESHFFIKITNAKATLPVSAPVLRERKKKEKKNSSGSSSPKSKKGKEEVVMDLPKMEEEDISVASAEKQIKASDKKFERTNSASILEIKTKGEDLSASTPLGKKPEWDASPIQSVDEKESDGDGDGDGSQEPIPMSPLESSFEELPILGDPNMNIQSEVDSSSVSQSQQSVIVKEEETETEQEEVVVEQQEEEEAVKESTELKQSIEGESLTPLSDSYMSNSQLSMSMYDSQIEKSPSLLEMKLAQLAEMGFTERMKNIELLVKNNGDMLETVKNLLDQN